MQPRHDLNRPANRNCKSRSDGLHRTFTEQFRSRFPDSVYLQVIEINSTNGLYQILADEAAGKGPRFDDPNGADKLIILERNR